MTEQLHLLTCAPTRNFISATKKTEVSCSIRLESYFTIITGKGNNSLFFPLKGLPILKTVNKWGHLLLSLTKSCLTIGDPMDCNTSGFPVFRYLPEFAQTHVHRVGDAIQPSHPLSSPSPPALSLSQHQGLFQWVILHSSWLKDWSFSFSTSPFNEYSVLISIRIDWFDLLGVQGVLKSLLQHHNLKALILQLSAFFMVQLSHPYMTTGKTIALTIRTFVGKVISLPFNTLSRFVIAFLPR